MTFVIYNSFKIQDQNDIQAYTYILSKFSCNPIISLKLAISLKPYKTGTIFFYL